MLFALAAGVGLLGTTGARAEGLGIGDPAPKLDVKEFVKGEPVKSFESGKLYVVEFWATWCGPCRVTIPHLTELQKKHPEVTFIGVSVWEESQKEVKPFVDDMGDKMDYRVALDNVSDKADGNEGPMAVNWMKAADQNGIPTAFIINKESKIAWIGHPSSMDEPLEKIVGGQWDINEAIAEHKREVEERVKFEKVQAKLLAAMRTNDPKQVLDAIDEAVKEVPSLERDLARLRFSTLALMDSEDSLVETGETLIKGETGKDPRALNAIAWSIVDPESKRKHKPGPKLLKFAAKAAERADELEEGKNPYIADTLAKVYFDSGDAAKALETQKRAIANAKGTDLEDEPGLKERLEQYQKAVDEGKE